MSDRYTKIYTLQIQPLPEELESPLEIAAGALLFDNKTNSALAQLKFKNISKKSIKCVEINISAFDINNTKIKNLTEYTYQNVKASSGDFFGDNEPIILEDKNAQSFSVEIINVTFSDGSHWKKNEKEAIINAKKFGQQAIETTSDIAEQSLKVTKATAKTAFKVVKPILIFLKVILNLIITGLIVTATYSVTKDFLAEMSIIRAITAILYIFASVISLPYWGKITFKDKYTLKLRLLRWLIFLLIIVVNSAILRSLNLTA